MPGIVGQGVTLKGFTAQNYNYTWLISGTAGVNPGIGVPMVLDTAADFTVKQVVDNGVLIGALESYENRVQEGIVVGVIKRKGTFEFDYTGTTPTRGHGVVGSATANKVKTAGAAVVNNIIVGVDTVNLKVIVVFD